MRRRPLSDQSVGAVYGAMVLMDERRNGEVDSVKLSILLWLGLSVLPSSVHPCPSGRDSFLVFLYGAAEPGEFLLRGVGFALDRSRCSAVAEYN